MEVKCQRNRLSTNQIAETDAMLCRVISDMAGIFRSVGGQSRSLVVGKLGQNQVQSNNYVATSYYLIIDARGTEAKITSYFINFWTKCAMYNYFLLIKLVTYVMWHCVSEITQRCSKSDRIYPTALLGVFCVWMRNIGEKRRFILGKDSPKSQKITPKSIRCKEYIDVSYSLTLILHRMHAQLKHGLGRFVRNYPHVRNSMPLP